MCVCVCVCTRSHGWLFAIWWTVAHQAPLSVGFSRQEYWRRLPFPPPGDLSNPGIEATSLVSPALASEFFTMVPPGKRLYMYCFPLLFKNVYLFIFGCAGSLLLHGLFSSGERGLLPSCSGQASHCCRFSCCRAQVLEFVGSSICWHVGSVVEAPGL